MKNIFKNNLAYSLIATLLVGAVLAFVPWYADAQTYYNNNSYGGYYNGYGNGSVNMYHHAFARRSSYVNNYYQTYAYQPYYYQYNIPLTVSCSSVVGSDYMGSYVMWNAYVSGGSGNYYYVWSGTDNPISLNYSGINVYYQIPGTKTMTVTVYSSGQTASANCGSTYLNNYYYPNNYNYGYGYQNQYSVQYPIMNYQYTTMPYQYNYAY